MQGIVLAIKGAGREKQNKSKFYWIVLKILALLDCIALLIVLAQAQSNT